MDVFRRGVCLYNRRRFESVVTMNPILIFLKRQPVRILMYIATGILIGSWLGNHYPKQTATFWGQPLIALLTAIAGLWASIQNNKEQAIDKIVAKIQDPPENITLKEAQVLTKAGVKIPLNIGVEYPK